MKYGTIKCFCVRCISTIFLNSFHATDLFWYPLKTSENQKFSDVFRGYQNRSVAWNELKYWFLQICKNMETQYGQPTVWDKDKFLLRQITFSIIFWKGEDQKGMHRGTSKFLLQIFAWRGLTVSCARNGYRMSFNNSLVIRQKGDSQNGCFEKTKHTKVSEKRTFLTSWYAHVQTFLTPWYAHVRNVRFSESLTCFVFLKHPFWDLP